MNIVKSLHYVLMSEDRTSFVCRERIEVKLMKIYLRDSRNTESYYTAVNIVMAVNVVT